MLILNTWNSYKWTDARLSWDPAHYGNITELRFPHDKVKLILISVFSKSILWLKFFRFGFRTLLFTTLKPRLNIWLTIKLLSTHLEWFWLFLQKSIRYVQCTISKPSIKVQNCKYKIFYSRSTVKSTMPIFLSEPKNAPSKLVAGITAKVAWIWNTRKVAKLKTTSLTAKLKLPTSTFPTKRNTTIVALMKLTPVWVSTWNSIKRWNTRMVNWWALPLNEYASVLSYNE